MKRLLKDLKEIHSWFRFGEYVILITSGTIAQIAAIIGGGVLMPWYFYMGILICAAGFLPLALETYKGRKVPLVKAVNFFDHALKRKNKELPFDSYPLFFCSESPYSVHIKHIMILLLRAAQNRKIILVGRVGALLEEKIDPYDINLERIRFVNDLPVLCDFSGKETYCDLRVDRLSFVDWMKKELASLL